MLPTVLTSVWVNTALSTTVTLRLRHGMHGQLEVGGVVRFAELPAAGRIAEPWPAGLSPLDGHQHDALASGLPIGCPTTLDRQLPTLRDGTATDVLRSLALPAGGCGQLVGADHGGRAIAVPLAGPAVRAVLVAADARFVAQLMLRTIAIGATVTIHTIRPAHWAALVAAVGDPRVLSVGSQRTAGARAGHRVAVIDGVAAPPTEPGTTQIVVAEPGASPEHLPATDVQVIIRQNPDAPQEISITTPLQRVRATMVATPEEWQLIGR